MTTVAARPSFQSFFQTPSLPRDKFLARVFGLFNEQPVHIWCRDPNSPYEDLGRPTLIPVGDTGGGKTLDFTLRSRRDGRVFVAEMKCEITYENYRSMVLRSALQLERHRNDKEGFRKFLEVAGDPTTHRVALKGRSIPVDGAILIWGAYSNEGRQEVLDRTGIFDVLSLEKIIESLIHTRNPEFQHHLEQRLGWCEELFDFLAGRN